jgi:hypothetical protein
MTEEEYKALLMKMDALAEVVERHDRVFYFFATSVKFFAVGTPIVVGIISLILLVQK